MRSFPSSRRRLKASSHTQLLSSHWKDYSTICIRHKKMNALLSPYLQDNPSQVIFAYHGYPVVPR